MHEQFLLNSLKLRSKATKAIAVRINPSLNLRRLHAKGLQVEIATDSGGIPAHNVDRLHQLSLVKSSMTLSRSFSSGS